MPGRKGPPEAHLGSSRSAVIKVCPPPQSKTGSMTWESVRDARFTGPTPDLWGRQHPALQGIWRHDEV